MAKAEVSGVVKAVSDFRKSEEFWLALQKRYDGE